MSADPRIIRLWWRCTVCRRRFDTFGTGHDRDAIAAADHAMQHLYGHGITPTTYTEAVSLIEPDGATSRVVRHSLIVNPAELEAK